MPDPSTVLSVLPNGLPVAVCPMPHVESFTAGLWLRAGARHEPARLNGISHFLEHLVFKGTARHSARAVSLGIESAGGEINASTAPEFTHFFVTAPVRHWRRVCDILFDIYLHPKLAPEDIELERGVIAEEIAWCHDDGEERVHELVDALVWPRHSMGRPVAGTARTLPRISRADLHAHHRGFYHADGTILSMAGAVDPRVFVEFAAEKLGSMKNGKCPRFTAPPPPIGGPVFTAEERSLRQTHLVFAWRVPGFRDADRAARQILCVMLGGNSSSRLFQEVRERRGLCYSISADLALFHDTGMSSVSVSLDLKNARRAARAVFRQLRDLSTRVPARAELDRAREYLAGSSGIALERTSAQENRLGHSMLVHGTVLPRSEWIDRLRAVTPEKITEIAARDFQFENLRLAAVGSAGCGETCARILGDAEDIRGVRSGNSK